jgi:lysine-N-methylase
VDQQTYEKYRQLPPGPLRSLIDVTVIGPAPDTEAPPVATFAKIQMSDGNRCPMLLQNGLCRIQSEVGESFLSHVCATYPRTLHFIDRVPEKSLSLSCPEAARLVLLDPELFAADLSQQDEEETGRLSQNSAGEFSPDGGAVPAAPVMADQGPSEGEKPAVPANHSSRTTGTPLLLSNFWAIRATVLSLVRNRDNPLWQRLFLLGILCRRLDAIAKGELHRGVSEFLRDFEATVATGALKVAMEALPLDRTSQLDVVLRLAGSMLHRSNVRPRFVECIHAFTAGIGNGPGSTIESLTAHYAYAHDRFYAPFMDRNPHILENYLVNTILRCNFPFGKEARQQATEFSMAREFALLTAQFALMKGLLIGVAGFHGERFGAVEVVHTFQAAAKHFEHHPEFLKQAHALLVESQMDGARGLGILLRNTEPVGPRPTAPEVQVPAQQGGGAR